MKAVAAIALLVAAGTASAAPYAIDPTHTFVYAGLRVFGLSTQQVRFARKQGHLDFDARAQTGHVEITVDTAAVSTGVAALDERLRALLDTAQFPQARFVGERFGFSDGRLATVAGTLTLRGRSAPFELKATRFDCYLNPLFRRQVCGGDFEARLSRSEWGLTGAGDADLADEVQLQVQVEAIRQ